MAEKGQFRVKTDHFHFFFVKKPAKRIKINNENSRLKNQLQEQQRRVQNAKNEHQKRKKEHEKGLFQSFFEKFYSRSSQT